MVDSYWPAIVLPSQFSEEEKIVLNISPMAIRDLSITNESISFVARFNGETFTITIPIGAILAIYAQENGQGMVFEAESHSEFLEDNTETKTAADSKSATPLLSISNPNIPVDKSARSNVTKDKPSLKIIK